MAKMPTSGDIFGASIKRREDPRFIRGKGQYTDDLKLPGTVHTAFVRSPHAHARIRSIHSSPAKAVAGVLAVYTGEDLANGGVNPIPVGWLLEGMKLGERRAIALGRVRYVGEAVAMVVAETAGAARDAAELVDVEYDVLPAIADVLSAVQPNAPAVYDEADRNVCFEWNLGDAAATDAAFRSAAKVVKQRLINQRLTPNAIEPRACVASWNPATQDLTLWVTSQNPHVHRLIMGAFVLGIPEHKFRVISPDVGGGFGSKIFVYPEEVAVCWASKTLGRPVKWTAERRESFLTDSQGRDHVSDAEIAVSADGRILGLRVHTLANLGANLSLFAPVIPTYLYGTLLSGQYTTPAIHVTVTGVFTNTVPVDAVRGAGRPEATFVVERMMDLAAAELGMDPAEIRRRNMVQPNQFPFQTAVALQYDSGNYEVVLDRALDKVGYPGMRAEQKRLRAEGRYIGIGLASYIEACGLAPSKIVGALGAQAGLYESGQVRVHPTGKVTVFTGCHSHGQGHETTYAQIVAQELGVPLDDVEIVHGDTATIAFGMGTYGSRSGPVGGSAIFLSAQKIKNKAIKIAAHLLEAAEQDIVAENGRFEVRGSPDRFRSFQDVALTAYLAHNMPDGMEPGLDATTFFDPPNWTYPFGTHIAVVEVDRQTGHVKLLRYIAVDDVGNVINPMIVDGMLHGGIAHGVGQALWEEIRYDAAGQLLTGSLMDYAIPKADQLPSFELDRTVTPSPSNPLGVKGAGEAGAIAASAAVANAVIDALAPFGVRHLDMPYTSQKVWETMKGAKGGAN
jgi:carbon-monoxide dehydrogenase large subunit